MPLQFAPLSSAFTSRECMLLVTGWYYPTLNPPPSGNDKYHDDFKWTQPITYQDGNQGRICEKSGAWFPAHLIRLETDPESENCGKWVGHPFWPTPKPFAPAQPRTWGDPVE